MSVKDKINFFKKDIGKTKLVAISKTKPNEKIIEAYNAEQRIFGENKVQELVSKYESLPKDIEWHFIGHLQSNKVKFIAPFIKLIHSVDSLKLLKEINKQAAKNNRTIDCLFQVKIADEKSKFGLNYNSLLEILISNEYKELKNIKIVGLMGMATNTDDDEKIGKEYSEIQEIFKKIKTEYFCNNSEFCELSIGMTGDYQIALNYGSTMIRIGSGIFGERLYH